MSIDARLNEIFDEYKAAEAKVKAQLHQATEDAQIEYGRKLDAAFEQYQKDSVALREEYRKKFNDAEKEQS